MSSMSSMSSDSIELTQLVLLLVMILMMVLMLTITIVAITIGITIAPCHQMSPLLTITPNTIITLIIALTPHLTLPFTCFRFLFLCIDPLGTQIDVLLDQFC